jgi:hypothetical protein
MNGTLGIIQMKKKLLIKKGSGEMEPFSRNKLISSLLYSGADDITVKSIITDVESWLYDGMSSKKIYDRAFAILRRNQLGVAARYKLKNAMMEMGPTGYPFEFFIGQVFKTLGFQVEVGQVLQGHCVTHEVDVIATMDHQQHFIECKYYQRTGKNANVQVPLYIRSRVDDIINYRKNLPPYSGYTFHGGVATNTRFTSDAISFGECTGLQMLSWDYPPSNGLKEIIDRERLFPVTVLTKLLIAEKHKLMERGIVICRQLDENPAVLESIGLDQNRQKKVMEEVRFLCR